MDTGSILLVASNNAVLESLSPMLQKRGYRVTPISCEGGRPAFPSQARFDYVFVDVGSTTPYLNIFRHFKAADPSTKFVFVGSFLAPYCQQQDTILTNVPIVLDYPCTSEELDQVLRHARAAKSSHELVGQDIFRDVPWLDPDYQVGDAIRYMYSHNIGAVGCIENGLVRGLLSYSGVVAGAFDPSKAFFSRRLAEVVEHDFVLMDASPNREQVAAAIDDGWAFSLIVDANGCARQVNLMRLQSYFEEIDEDQFLLKMMDASILAKLAAASGDYHAIIDSRGEILHANRRMQADFLRQGVNNYFDLVGQLANRLDASSGDPTIIESFESTIKTTNGREKTVRWEIVGDGRRFFIRGVDQTQLKDATRQIDEARKAAARNQKFSVIGGLAGSFLPALKGSLTTMQFKLETARQSPVIAPSMSNKLQETENILAQMSNLVEAVSDLASDDDHKSRSWVSLRSIVRQAQELLGSRIKRSACEFRLDLQPAELFCHRGAIVQVFCSVFSEAIDGLFDFADREIHLQARIQTRGQVVVSVSSQVRGNESDFVTLYRPFDGDPGALASASGASLPISREVIHDHQGEIWSEVVGSVRHFYMVLKGRKAVEAINFVD